MERNCRWSVAGIALAILFSVQTAHAAKLSPNNPYRSFNLTGVNYGAMQWEREHAKKKHPATEAEAEAEVKPTKPSALSRLWNSLFHPKPAEPETEE